jgi:hypothetical protein
VRRTCSPTFITCRQQRESCPESYSGPATYLLPPVPTSEAASLEYSEFTMVDTAPESMLCGGSSARSPALVRACQPTWTSPQEHQPKPDSLGPKPEVMPGYNILKSLSCESSSLSAAPRCFELDIVGLKEVEFFF